MPGVFGWLAGLGALERPSRGQSAECGHYVSPATRRRAAKRRAVKKRARRSR